jgi:hypothetical protein
MFVSKAAARARLSDPANLFRGSSAVVLSPSGELTEEEAVLIERTKLQEVSDRLSARAHEEMLEQHEPTRETRFIEDPIAREGVRQAVELMTAGDRLAESVAAAQDGPKLPTGSALDSLIADLTSSPKQRPSYRMKREVQASIGTVALMTGNKDTRAITGQGENQTRLYENSKTVRGAQHPELKRRMDETRMVIARVTASKLRKVIRGIEDSDIDAIESVAERARIGKDLVTIIDKVTPKDTGTGEGVHFHIYRPEQGVMTEYEKVTVTRRAPSEGYETIDASS